MKKTICVFLVLLTMLTLCSCLGSAKIGTIDGKGVSVEAFNYFLHNVKKELLFEACKQSGNPFLPQVEEPVKFEKALEDSHLICQKRYFGSVRECPDSDAGETVRPENAAWFVGPEGGFTDQEDEAMLRDGIAPLHFGNWVLRVETAAICGLALIHSLCKKESSL